MEQPNFLGNVGLSLAHPDDHITVKDAIQQTHLASGTLHELTYTLGRASTNNFRSAEDPLFSVKNGDRVVENREAARILGITSLMMLDAKDGDLVGDHDKLVGPTLSWIYKQNIQLLVTSGGLQDHNDHQESAYIAMHASAIATRRGHPVDILELQHGYPELSDETGAITFPRSISAISLALRAARKHRSQFQFAKAYEQPDWPVASGGYVMHAKTRSALSQYAIWSGSTYRFIPADSLALRLGV